MMTLWQVKAKQHAEIAGLDLMLNPAVASRLQEMGFIAGQLIQCLRRAPLNGPLVLQIGDSVFSVEQKVAERVKVLAFS